MARPTPNPDPKDRAGIEAKCLLSALIPTPENNGRKVAKAVALILVCIWSVVTIGLTFEGIATVAPPVYSPTN